MVPKTKIEGNLFIATEQAKTEPIAGRIIEVPEDPSQTETVRNPHVGFVAYVPTAAVIWAVCYYGYTFGSSDSATIGMRVMDLEMRTWYGAPAYFVLGAVHAIVYWVTVSFFTPFILLVAYFNRRRRLLHDMLVGTIVINNPARAQALHARWR